MGVDDKNGIVYVNTNGYGAGNAEEMRKNIQHDGSHGTYVNKDVDEDSAKKIGQINGDRTESNLIVGKSLKDKIKEGTDAYNKAVENGDIRNLGGNEIKSFLTSGLATVTKDFANSSAMDIQKFYNFSDEEIDKYLTAFNRDVKNIDRSTDTALGLIFSGPSGAIVLNLIDIGVPPHAHQVKRWKNNLGHINYGNYIFFSVKAGISEP